MPNTHLMRATLHHNSGLVDDDVVMTFPLYTPVDLELNADQLGDAMESFLAADNAAGAPIRAVADHLQATIGRGSDHPHTIEVYELFDLTGGPLGSPYAVGSFALGNPGTTQYGAPSEMQCVITLEGDGRDTAPVEVPNPVPGGKPVRPKQRLTGRLFVGPLDANCLGLVAGEYRFTETFIDDLLVATARFRNYLLDNVGAVWQQWSREEARLVDIVAVSVDDAPDTQRRRGVAPSRRKRVSVLAP